MNKQKEKEDFNCRKKSMMRKNQLNKGDKQLAKGEEMEKRKKMILIQQHQKLLERKSKKQRYKLRNNQKIDRMRSMRNYKNLKNQQRKQPKNEQTSNIKLENNKMGQI